VGYTGHKFDADLGLSYMQARYYDPVIGRFYSNDPKGFRDVHSFNRYTYANNNPYRYIDPDGQESISAQQFDIEVRGVGSGQITRAQHSANVSGRASASRHIAKLNPIGRTVLAVLSTLDSVTVMFEGETDSEDLSAEEIDAIEKENKQEAIDEAFEAYQNGGASNIDGDEIGRNTKQNTEKDLDNSDKDKDND
jgi:RHS repeat-associated protein